MAMQLKWSRTINVHGRPGKNIAADLHMEHLNRECKEALSGLGANITDHAVHRVGLCIGRMVTVLKHYDEVNDVGTVSGAHTCRSTKVDLEKMLKQLTDVKVFDVHPGRFHSTFPKFTSNLIHKLSNVELHSKK